MRIGLLLTGNHGWAGGLYYVFNIAAALCSLPHDEKPEIVVFYGSHTPPEVLGRVRKMGCKLVKIDDLAMPARIMYRVLRLVTGRNYQFERIINPEALSILYPLTEYTEELRQLNCKLVYWLYDFQHFFLPEFFPSAEIKRRNRSFTLVARYAAKVVVSSYTALSHFEMLFPNSHAQVNVLPFITLLDDLVMPDISSVRKKYGVEGPYFLVANQFWQHKNHMAVLKAQLILHKQGIRVKVVYTGNTTDQRNSSYFSQFKRYIEINELQEDAIVLGFIAREDQLCLMQHCLAVVQPSQFEGWSTVVEDAKALNKSVVLSDIPVHREQVVSGGCFFPPEDARALSDILARIWIDVESEPCVNFASRMSGPDFARVFLSLAKQ